MKGKRIILVSEKEIVNYRSIYARAPGAIIIRMSEILLEGNVPGNRHKEIEGLGDGDGIMAVGKVAFGYIKSLYHLGIRNENAFDCSLIPRISMYGGAYLKVCDGIPNVRRDVEPFMSEDFVEKSPVNKDVSTFNVQIAKTYKEAIDYLTEIDNAPLDYPMGFDYETSGVDTKELYFYVSGFALATEQGSFYVSLSDIKRTSTGQQLNHLYSTIARFIEKRQEYLWPFNKRYEYEVTHREFGIDAFEMADAAVINILDGFHQKRYSLKWTAQRVLGVDVWDTDFDILMELLESMFFEVVGKGKNRTYELKVTKRDYKRTKEWEEISRRYPAYVDEFEQLINEYWAMPSMCIPSDILGRYCCLDSYYTLLIYLSRKESYSEEAFSTFLDNNSLGVRLMSSGLYIDEVFRRKYKEESLKMMAWGITYSAIARSKIVMDSSSEAKKSLGARSKFFRDLVENDFVALKIETIAPRVKGPTGIDWNYTAKALAQLSYDSLGTEEKGLSTGNILMGFSGNEEAALKVIEMIKESMEEAGVKKIEENISRKRKFIGIFEEKIIQAVGKIPTGKKFINSMVDILDYSKYKPVYKELINVNYKYTSRIDDIQPEIKVHGNQMPLEEYCDYISKDYFRSKSPIENDLIISDMIKLYRKEVSWIGGLKSCMQQLPGNEHFYENLGITDPTEAFEHFMAEWEGYYKKTMTSFSYPEKMFLVSMDIWQTDILVKPKDKAGEELIEKIKEIWTDFSGITTIYSMFPGLEQSEYQFIQDPWQESDMDDRLRFMRKFTAAYLAYKKYSKVLSTYIDGMFYKNSKWVIENPRTKIPIRYAKSPDEPGAIFKAFVNYEVNMKSSKRWSSGFHTIISKSDLKDCITTPPSYDESGEIIYGGGEYLLSYFDISSAEVRAAAAASRDVNLMNKFINGEDIYIYCASLYVQGLLERNDKKEIKRWRGQFKTVFLGIMYGLGRTTLAAKLDCTPEEADMIIESVFQAFPDLRHYIQLQQQYPIDNHGEINTMLGDTIVVPEYGWLMEAKERGDMAEARRLEARLKRLGVNLPIQGGTSSLMAKGFWNNVRVSLNEGWKCPLVPIIVVHDSNTNYFPVSKVFELRKFYDVNYTEYIKNMKSQSMTLLYDLLEGNSYESASQVEHREENLIEYSGSARTLIPLYDKIMNCPDFKVEASMRREDLAPNLIHDPIERFIRDEGTSVVKDTSYYTIQFRRVA